MRTGGSHCVRLRLLFRHGQSRCHRRRGRSRHPGRRYDRGRRIRTGRRPPRNPHRCPPRPGRHRPRDGQQQLRTDGFGLGVLLEKGRIRRTISSYVGANKEFARQYLAGGELEVELTPQAPSPSACAPAAPAFRRSSPPAGVGTQVEEGGLPPLRYDGKGGIAVASPHPRRPANSTESPT